MLPYRAIAWNEKFIANGTPSILNPTVTLFTALLVDFLPFPEERPTSWASPALPGPCASPSDPSRTARTPKLLQFDTMAV